jgi:hypothetical protein
VNFKEYITKLQNLPEQKKKIILWVIVGIVAIVMGYFWSKSAAVNFSKIGQELQKIELPKIETPEFPEINLENIQ